MNQEAEKPLKEMSNEINKIINVMEDLDMSVYRKDNRNYNLNIVGVRSTEIMVNAFNDKIFVFWWYNGLLNHLYFPCTTLAGLIMLEKPVNPKGCAILKEGQYKSTWKLDLHRGKYTALCQRLNDVVVYRDADGDKEFDFINESTEKGKFGINIHRASTLMDLTEIGRYSAGCQVLPKYTDWVTFIGLCELAVKNGFKNSFTYTLLKEEWL